MGLLSTFKVMKVLDCDDSHVALRTSRACSVLGFMFIFAGLAIVFHLLVGKLFYSLLPLCMIGLALAFAFVMSGLILFTYNRQVRINKAEQKLWLRESSVLGVRDVAYHFDEIISVELTRDCECFCSRTASLWVVKVYFSDSNGFSAEKIFTTIYPSEAKFAAETLSFAAKKELVISCMPEERLVFSRI